MQNIDILKLIPHPRNHEFFDNIEDGKWEDFKKSIIRRGVVESIVVTQDLMIVSGHQRVRACTELGILSVPCRITHYPDNDQQTGNPKEDMIIEDLICTNIMQRGIGNVNPMKMAKCIIELERIYGIKTGNPQLRQIVAVKNQSELASQLGMSERQMQRSKELFDLVPDLQNMVEEGKMKESAARTIIKSLSPEEQESFFLEIGKDALSKLTEKEVKLKIESIQNKNIELTSANELLKQQLAEKKDVETRIEKAIEDKRKVELDLVNLRNEKTKIEYIDRNVEIDKPETTAKITRLENQIKEKEEYVEKYKNSLTELTEKNAIINKFMGENTNFQLVSKTSEITLKMMDFTKEMSKYDYLSDVFNEIPDATRKEYVRSIYGVLKWARNILQEVKHDDVIGVNKNVIEIKNTKYEEIN